MSHIHIHIHMHMHTHTHIHTHVRTYEILVVQVGRKKNVLFISRLRIIKILCNPSSSDSGKIFVLIRLLAFYSRQFKIVY